MDFHENDFPQDSLARHRICACRRGHGTKKSACPKKYQTSRIQNWKNQFQWGHIELLRDAENASVGKLTFKIDGRKRRWVWRADFKKSGGGSGEGFTFSLPVAECWGGYTVCLAETWLAESAVFLFFLKCLELLLIHLKSLGWNVLNRLWNGCWTPF